MEVGIFELEVREKKNQAFLQKSKTGSRGGSKSRKGMRTPYDSLKPHEKRKLNGEVQVTMYETILTKEEFDLKDKEMQKLMLTRWRELYSNKEIQSQMKLHNVSYYKLVDELGLPKKESTPRSPRTPRKSKTIAVVDKAPELLEFAPESQVAIPEEEPPKVKPILISKGLHLEYNGEYNADQLSKIFTKLQLLIEGEENKFNVSISLTERT
jgi:hypothetical protein